MKCMHFRNFTTLFVKYSYLYFSSHGVYGSKVKKRNKHQYVNECHLISHWSNNQRHCIPRECIYFPGSRHSQWGDSGLYSNRLNTVEPLCATAAHKQPPIQNTKIFSVKALQLEPLANNHLLYVTATTFWVSRSIICHKRPVDAFSALYFGCVYYVP